MTLRTFLEQTALAIRGGVPRRVWLEVAVVAVKCGAFGHQLELADPDETASRASPQLRAFFSKAERSRAEVKLGVALDPVDLIGMTATLLVEPDFHPRYHLQGRVVGLSQGLRQSLLAKAVAQIRAKLQQEGQYDRQRRLDRPVDITRLVVIHPTGAAGYADISAVLTGWHTAGIIQLTSIPATFEGDRAPAALVAALEQAQQARDFEFADVIALVRGGGDRAGLMVLDNERVARAICECPIPVVTGLGHSIDVGLLDEVSHASLDTPSKILGHLEAIIVIPARRAVADMNTIEAARRLTINDASRSLNLLRHKVIGEAGRRLSDDFACLATRWAGVRADGAALGERCGRLADEARRQLGLALDRAPLRVDAADQDLRRVLDCVADRVRLRLDRTEKGDALFAAIVSRSSARLDEQTTSLVHCNDGLELAVARTLNQVEGDLASLWRLVEDLDVEATLRRGYALIAAEDGRLISTREAALLVQRFSIGFVDGAVAARLELSESAT